MLKRFQAKWIPVRVKKTRQNKKALASAATAARRGALFRPATIAGFIRFALDPDNGKNKDGAHAFARRAIHGWAQPPRCRIRRKFNNSAHAKFSLVAASCDLRATRQH
jgi:hypothetical protein